MPHRRIAVLCLLAVLFIGCSAGPRGIQGTYPIVSDPPTALPTPGWRALSEAYMVVADRAGQDFGNLFDRRGLYRDNVRGHHLWCSAFMAIDAQFAKDVKKIPFTEEYRKHVKAVLDKTDSIIAILKKCVKSKSLKTIRSLERKADDAYLVRQKASGVLRRDLHLN